MVTKKFQQLIVWQKAHQFVLSIYTYVKQFPKEEIYALTSQLKRAAISVPANIAEGYKKQGKADKARFFNISQGSLSECEYYLILSQDLGYGNSEQLLSDLDEISRLLESYRSKILSSNS